MGILEVLSNSNYRVTVGACSCRWWFRWWVCPPEESRCLWWPCRLGIPDVMAVLICSWPCRLVHVMGKSGEWKRSKNIREAGSSTKHALIKPGIHSKRGVSWGFGCWCFRFVMISPILVEPVPMTFIATWWPISSPRFHDRNHLISCFFQAVPSDVPMFHDLIMGMSIRRWTAEIAVPSDVPMFHDLIMGMSIRRWTAKILWPCDLKHSGDRLLTSLKSGDLEAVELSEANSCIVSGDARGTVFKKGPRVSHVLDGYLTREGTKGWGAFLFTKTWQLWMFNIIILYYILLSYIYIHNWLLYYNSTFCSPNLWDKLIGFIHALQ